MAARSSGPGCVSYAPPGWSQVAVPGVSSNAAPAPDRTSDLLGVNEALSR